MSRQTFSRRSFLAVAASAPLLSAAPRRGKIPVGLELYSVRDKLQQDLMGTVRGVAKMGYECVEFYSPYYAWTPDYAKEVRRMLDDSGIRCYSTHNDAKSFRPEGIDKAIELNNIIGSKTVVLASPGRIENMDSWKKVADLLTSASEKLKPAGMRVGYHNHLAEFKELDGKRPIEVIAANTPKDVTLQLDVGTCLEASQDPVAWIAKNPGRIRSMHLKDWSPDKDKGYKVLFGEGIAPWKKIFDAAEKTGGVEYYLIEQEGSSMPSMETVERCLAEFNKIHKSA